MAPQTALAIALAMLLVLLPLHSECAVVMVPPAPLTIASIVTTIQGQSGFASTTVIIPPGVWTGPCSVAPAAIDIDLSLFAADIRIFGSGIGVTILDCGYTGRALSLSGYQSGFEIGNFTITRGDGLSQNGGAVVIADTFGPGKLLSISMENSTTTGSGGCLAFTGSGSGANFTCDRCLFRGCHATLGGGGLFAPPNGGRKVTLNSASFLNCTTGPSSPGGGIQWGNGTVLWRNLYVASCRAGTNGGGAAISGSSIWRCETCQFKSNRAGANGGGVAISGGAAANFTSVNVFFNNAGGLGGGVFSAGSTVEASTSVIHDNSASAGGGWYSSSFSLDSLIGCSIAINNALVGDGGGLYIDGATVTVIGGTSTNNEAELNGGAVYARNGATVQPSWANTGFYYNRARNGSAFYFAASAVVHKMTNVLVTLNTAFDLAALYAEGPAIFPTPLLGYTRICNNDAFSCHPDIYCAAGEAFTGGGPVPPGLCSGAGLLANPGQYCDEFVYQSTYAPWGCDEGWTGPNCTIRANCSVGTVSPTSCEGECTLCNTGYGLIGLGVCANCSASGLVYLGPSSYCQFYNPPPPPRPPPPSPPPSPPPPNPPPSPPPSPAPVTAPHQPNAPVANADTFDSNSPAGNLGSITLYIVAVLLVLAVAVSGRIRRRNAEISVTEPRALVLKPLQFVLAGSVLWGVLFKVQGDGFSRRGRVLTLVLELEVLWITAAVLPLLQPASAAAATASRTKALEMVFNAVVGSLLSYALGAGPLRAAMARGGDLRRTVAFLIGLALVPVLFVFCVVLVVLTPVVQDGVDGGHSTAGVATVWVVSVLSSVFLVGPAFLLFKYYVWAETFVFAALARVKPLGDDDDDPPGLLSSDPSAACSDGSAGHTPLPALQQAQQQNSSAVSAGRQPRLRAPRAASSPGLPTGAGGAGGAGRGRGGPRSTPQSATSPQLLPPR